MEHQTLWSRLTQATLPPWPSMRVPILMASLAITLIISITIYQQQVKQVHGRFANASNDRFRAIHLNLQNSSRIGKSMSKLFTAFEKVSRNEFSALTRLFLADYKHIHAIEWAPYIRREQRRDFEATASAHYPGFHIQERDGNEQLVNAAEREEYFPIFFVEPYAPNERALGFDLASDPARQQALNYAISNNQPSITERINLIQNPAAPSFLMYYPVYDKSYPGGAPANPREHLLGLVIIVFDIQTLIESALHFLHPAGIDISISDLSVSGPQQLVYQQRSDLTQTLDTSSIISRFMTSPTLSLRELIQVNNREWAIASRSLPKYFDTGIGVTVWLVFCSGLVISLLLFFYLRLLNRQANNLAKDKGKLEQIVAQRTMELREQYQEMESYSYSIAHDLRAPLRGITGFSQILIEDASAKLNLEERQHLDRIIASSKRMARLIDDILNLARISRSPIKRTTVDLSEMGRSTAQRLSSMPEITQPIAWDIDDHLIAQGDPVLLQLLLDNLIGNAIKFSAHQAHPQITIKSFNTKYKTIFYIRDNGIGFDMQYAEKIFGVFQRLHSQNDYEGTGIGLATVQRIVQRHGGHIWTDSQPDEGATFYFTLSEA